MKKLVCFILLAFLLVTGVLAQDADWFSGNDDRHDSGSFAELSWYFVTNNLVYKTYVFNQGDVEVFNIPVYGAMIDLFWGTSVSPFSHFKFGIAPSIYSWNGRPPVIYREI